MAVQQSLFRPMVKSEESGGVRGGSDQWLDIWFRVLAKSNNDAKRLSQLLSNLVSGGLMDDLLKLKVRQAAAVLPNLKSKSA